MGGLFTREQPEQRELTCCDHYNAAIADWRDVQQYRMRHCLLQRSLIRLVYSMKEKINHAKRGGCKSAADLEAVTHRQQIEITNFGDYAREFNTIVLAAPITCNFTKPADYVETGRLTKVALREDPHLNICASCLEPHYSCSCDITTI